MNIKDGDEIILLENGIDKANRKWSDEDIEKNFKGEIYGYLGVEPLFEPAVNLEKVSHKLVDIRIEGSTVKATAKFLETPMGRILNRLSEEGIMLDTNIHSIGYVEDGKMRDPAIRSINFVEKRAYSLD